jgi:hypothetical protein
MSPRTTELPRKDWVQALNVFSANHENWLMSLDVLSLDLGAQPEITELPLVGATFEAIDGGTVIVAAGRSAADHITHPIRTPRRIWIEQTDAGGDAALGIESADGTKTILRLKTAAPPETVDGIARP